MSYYPPQQPQQGMPTLGDFVTSVHQGAPNMGSGLQPGLQPSDIPSGQYPPSQLDPGVQQGYIDDETTMLDGSGPHRRPQQHYIEQEEEDDVVIQKATNAARTVNLEETYNALQLPIIVGVLFFLFQLPILKTWEFNYMAFAFTGDGNWNTTGILVNSGIFAAIVFVLQKFLAF